MKKFNQTVFLACGLLLMLAAFPVLAQDAQENKINKKPLADFFGFVVEEAAAENVDLTKPFAVELKGVLTKEGKLDAKKTKFTKSEGDDKTINVAKTFIEAVIDSGLFGYLRNFGVEKIKFALAQDDNQIYADIVLEQPTVEKARTLTSSLNAMLAALRVFSTTSEGKQRKFSDDEKTLIKGVTANIEDKNATLKFAYQKSVVHEMINRKLQELKQKTVK